MSWLHRPMTADGRRHLVPVLVVAVDREAAKRTERYWRDKFFPSDGNDLADDNRQLISRDVMFRCEENLAFGHCSPPSC
jgi:hypothetical protein